MFNIKTNKMKMIILIYHACSIIISMIILSGVAFKSSIHFTLAIILSILIGWLLVPLRLIIEIVRIVKKILKKAHLLPVYPIDILMEIKNNHSDTYSLCHGIILAERKFNLHEEVFTRQYIKKFDIDVAIHNFGGENKLYWWDPGIWNTGRLDFLNFLIEENKNNKIDLRKVY